MIALRRIFIGLCLMALLASSAAWVGTNTPVGIIEDSEDTFDPSAVNGILQDVTAGDASKWLANSVSSLTKIKGAAHAGQTGIDQATADARVTNVQIWSVRLGHGQTQFDNTTVLKGGESRWTKVGELTPSTGSGHVVGWLVDTSAPGTWSSLGDLCQSIITVNLASGQTYLLLIRVIDTTGVTNLYDSVGGSEKWENGDSSDSIGSNVPTDKYVDSKGNSPGTSDARLPARAIVCIYRPR